MKSLVRRLIQFVLAYLLEVVADRETPSLPGLELMRYANRQERSGARGVATNDQA